MKDSFLKFLLFFLCINYGKNGKKKVKNIALSTEYIRQKSSQIPLSKHERGLGLGLVVDGR